MSKNLAIALEIKKRNKKKAAIGDAKRSMDSQDMYAKGGEVEAETEEHSYQIKPIPGSSGAGYRISKKHKKTGDEDSYDVKGSESQAKEHVKNMVGAMAKDKPKLQKLAEGGMVSSSTIKTSKVDALGRKIPTMSELPPEKHEGMSEDKGPAEEEYMDDEMQPQYAEGGMIDDMDQPQPEADEEHHDSIAAAIMAKRQKYAEGGQVDLKLNSMEQPNDLDDLNEAALKEDYDSDFEDMTQPMDSNEHGDSREDSAEDKLDMISAIRKSMAKSRTSK